MAYHITYRGKEQTATPMRRPALNDKVGFSLINNLLVDPHIGWWLNAGHTKPSGSLPDTAGEVVIYKIVNYFLGVHMSFLYTD